MTWNDAPDGKRLMIGWMNNWLYGGGTPTSPWRSAMSVPRELGLRTVDGRPQLVQQPVASVDTLDSGQPYSENATTITGERTLAKRGDVLDIRATLRPGSATRTGLKVLTNANGDETVIGYDAAAGTLYVDRTKSGAAAAGLTGFPGVQSAPVALRDGALNLRVLVDRSLIEVYAQGGERTIADQVYPTPGSDGLKVFADGGSATLESLDVRELRSTWGALATSAPGGVGGSVPATLVAHPRPGGELRRVPARRGARLLGVDDGERHLHRGRRDADGELTRAPIARVTSSTASFSLPQPLKAAGSVLPATVRTWSQPVSNDAFTIPFTQSIAASDALRTGSYSKTLTFTLSTTTP